MRFFMPLWKNRFIHRPSHGTTAVWRILLLPLGAKASRPLRAICAAVRDS
jgi:hypothetical protein